MKGDKLLNENPYIPFLIFHLLVLIFIGLGLQENKHEKRKEEERLMIPY